MQSRRWRMKANKMDENELLIQQLLYQDMKENLRLGHRGMITRRREKIMYKKNEGPAEDITDESSDIEQIQDVDEKKSTENNNKTDDEISSVEEHIEDVNSIETHDISESVSESKTHKNNKNNGRGEEEKELDEEIEEIEEEKEEMTTSQKKEDSKWLELDNLYRVKENTEETGSTRRRGNGSLNANKPKPFSERPGFISFLELEVKDENIKKDLNFVRLLCRLRGPKPKKYCAKMCSARLLTRHKKVISLTEEKRGHLKCRALDHFMSLSKECRNDSLRHLNSIVHNPDLVKDKDTESTLIFRSPIQGWGVYAFKDIQPERLIGRYTGKIVPFNLCDPLENIYIAEGCASTYFFKLFERFEGFAVDAMYAGSICRFTNHSCQPNCRTRANGKTVEIVSIRGIAAGEELTYDYHLYDSIESNRSCERCNCGHPDCKHGFL